MTSSLTTVARGESSGIVDSQRAIVRDAGQWRALWAAHAGPATTAPDVDFASRMVAAVFAGERPTPGFGIEITGTARDGQALTLAVTERSPAPGMIAAQILVTPFHIVTLPRYDGEVRFVDASPPAGPQSGSTAGPKASVPTRPLVGATTGPLFGAATSPKTSAPPRPKAGATVSSSDAASSTGLDPNFAAALAYLAGPFSGILILLVERANRYVRFHAWQAIVGLGGLGALAVGVLVLSFLTLLLSPFVFTVMYRLSELIAVVWVVAWVMCLVKALTGNAWKMPVAGRYAERFAARRP
jgi:uncharacterized membrane protein